MFIHVHSSYIFKKKNVSCNVSYKGHCSSRRVDYPPHCSQFPWSASARHTACISKSQWLASHRWDYWGHLGSRDSRCHWLPPRCLGDVTWSMPFFKLRSGHFRRTMKNFELKQIEIRISGQASSLYLSMNNL